jgi:hypothetical protein
MKRLVALIGIFATVFAFASCKKLTPEEADASREAARSIAVSKYEKKLEESLRHEEEIYKEKSKTIAELGKTEKGKKIVYKSNNEIWTSKYYVAYMDKDGKLDYTIQYNYYPNVENYEFDVEKFKKSDDLEKTDDDMRLIIFKQDVEKGRGVTYDEYLEHVKFRGFEIIE